MTEIRVPYEANVHSAGIIDSEEYQAKLKIRNGLRLILAALEDLWGLPRSFETKREKDRDRGGQASA